MGPASGRWPQEFWPYLVGSLSLARELDEVEHSSVRSMNTEKGTMERCKEWRDAMDTKVLGDPLNLTVSIHAWVDCCESFIWDTNNGVWSPGKHVYLEEISMATVHVYLVIWILMHVMCSQEIARKVSFRILTVESAPVYIFTLNKVDHKLSL